MNTNSRISFTPIEGIEDIFTSEFINYLIHAHDMFSPRVHRLRAKRFKVLERALTKGVLPTYLPISPINTGDWCVPPVPDDLKRPGIEITGPASATSMFINALNPGLGGVRAEGDLDDDEDSSGHRFIDTLTATRNRLGAVEGTLKFFNPETEKTYEIEDGELPFFMHRERGLHLDEPDVRIDGSAVSAAILGTSLTLFHAGRAQMERGQGVYFYLPKLESAEEVGFWREFFDFSFKYLSFPDDGVLRAIPLVESLPLAYQMEESLHALGPYAAGLNAARWDFKASVLEFIMADPRSVWPDRFEIDIKTTEFLANIFRRLVAICLKRNAVPIGGMATALPSKDPEVNKVAADSIRSDKEWEAEQGFLRGWVAHIFHMDTAMEPFKKSFFGGRRWSPEILNLDKYPVNIEVPNGMITLGGTRRNVRMLIEYLEGWINGKGAKGIDSLEGQPGVHPPLMEDLATGRISVAQIAQRVRHSTQDTDTGETHNFSLIKRLLNEEVEDILQRRRGEIPFGRLEQRQFDEMENRYRKAVKIAMQWIKNYTDLDFRSLGSYTRDDLDFIVGQQDAF